MKDAQELALTLLGTLRYTLTKEFKSSVRRAPSNWVKLNKDDAYLPHPQSKLRQESVLNDMFSQLLVDPNRSALVIKLCALIAFLMLLK